MILTPEPPVSVAERVTDTVRRKMLLHEPLLHLIDATGFVVSFFTVVVVVAFVVVVVALVVVVVALVVVVVALVVVVDAPVVVVVGFVVEVVAFVVVVELLTDRSTSEASSTVNEPALERASPNDTPVGT
jgi:hypothetical protein